MMSIDELKCVKIPFSPSSSNYRIVRSYIDSKVGLTYLKKEKLYNSLGEVLIKDWNNISDELKDLMKIVLKIVRTNKKSANESFNNLIDGKYVSESDYEVIITGIIFQLPRINNLLFKIKYEYSLIRPCKSISRLV